MPLTIQPGSAAGSVLFSTVRILTLSGQQAGSGTGFIYNYVRDNDKVKDRGLPFLVTNRHVVQDTEVGQLVFLKAADKQLSAAIVGDKFHLTVTDFSQAWFYHPDPEVDLCIMELSTYFWMARTSEGFRPFMRSVNSSNFPSAKDLLEMDAVEDLLMVGYPNSLIDETNHLPIVRKGITATPYIVDYEGRAEFLIDASVFPGSSGSPVFLIDRHKQEIDPTMRVLLLGILSSGFMRSSTHEVTRIQIPTSESSVITISEMLDLGVVIKSSKLNELVNLWLEAFPSPSPDQTERNRDEASKIYDADINRIIYRLQSTLGVRLWKDLQDYVTSYTWHLLVQFKCARLEPLNKLLLKELLEQQLEDTGIQAHEKAT